MTITTQDYFKAYAGHAEITPAIEANADKLLVAVNPFLEDCMARGWTPKVNPATGTLISGSKNGGWRPPDCLVGAPSSSHKDGSGIDVADADNELDAVIDDKLLEKHGLYREAPSHTPNWAHLTTRAPRSGLRTFLP